MLNKVSNKTLKIAQSGCTDPSKIGAHLLEKNQKKRLFRNVDDLKAGRLLQPHS